MLTKILIKLLKSKISLKDKELILNTLLERINALPIRDLIIFDVAGTLKINDRTLDIDQAIVFKETVLALKNNSAYKIIKEQIAFEAIKIGIHKGNTLDQIMFSKAALWIQAEEIRLITQLSGQNEENQL